MASTDRPTILLLSISDHGYLDEICAPLFDQLSKSANLKSVKKAPEAIKALDEEDLKTVIITDEGLTERRNKKVLEKVKAYVENGGLAIVGLHFPAFVHFNKFGKFFFAFGLSWKLGTYTRNYFEFNQDCALPFTTVSSSFPGRFSMKALHVAHVQPDEGIFFPDVNYACSREAGIAVTQVGRGCLAYVGDVNGQTESNKAIIALCGFEEC
ncbi:hypothetical protein BJX66DRAFT_336960 [Aspergillus keveii]|uniref:Uncharacterized protein n=1 Tax=Aspergillus keveii TaxID=714993 RepID=A0ABR4G8T8_9EURO